ncbi:MAG TPA: hypothetical protein VMV71_00610 [Candidatus Paceibacterota bacterium]|nr:hypothetical protein [Candidatus Paceibacterota bacterium]
MPNYENPELGADVRERARIKRNIFELSGEDRAELERRVKKSGGLARIIIHPFYPVNFDYDGRLFTDKQKESLENKRKNFETFQAAIDRLFSSDPDKSPPIIVFEEEFNLEGNKNSYMGRDYRNEPYVVPTFTDNPTPKLSPNENWLNKDFDEKNGWNKLREIFKSLGIKKMLIGGTQLNISSNEGWKEWFIREMEAYEKMVEAFKKIKGSAEVGKPDYVLHGCVGNAISNLMDDFEIEVSSLAFPANRATIKK